MFFYYVFYLVRQDKKLRLGLTLLPNKNGGNMKFRKMPLNIQLFAEGDKDEPVTQTDESAEVSIQTDEKTEDNSKSKTFTQDEVNTLLRKERKKIPDKEELKAFNEWKESQKTEADKKNELTQENITLKQEKASLEQLLTIIDKGIAKDEAEFIQFKVGKMEGDFDDNLNEFLEKNPKYLKKEETVREETVTTDGVAVNKTTTNNENGVTAILKAKHPELNI